MLGSSKWIFFSTNAGEKRLLGHYHSSGNRDKSTIQRRVRLETNGYPGRLWLQSRQFQLGGALPFFITENSTIRRGGRPIRRRERGFGRLSGSDRSGQTIGFDIAPRRSQGLLPERSSVKDHYSERVRSAVKDYCRVDRRQRLLQTAWPKTLIVAY